MDPKEYELEFFKANGFSRRKCPSCGRHYWTLGEHDTCGEPPCAEYSFFDDPPMNGPRSVHEMRETYLSFFERHGHGRVPRYPITARWRDDVFFTQASIYDFQPWVINGVVDPPANPLTISQTCVRFNDIDNVGKTGRHFTMFEMIAHHAFNKEGEFVYFKDRTVELCHLLLTEELGIDEKEPTYIEEWWEGGGNSGPCFETIVRGVELSTLVFMMYEETPEGRKPLPMQVVDTGYGLERFAWVSQGAPNAYEAVFPELVGKLKELLGLDVDANILKRYSALCSKADVHSQGAIKKVKEELAGELGMGYDALSGLLRPFEQIYTVLDHTRGLMFLLNDGVVPSNVKDGYFARLLARRTLRALDTLKLDLGLPEAVSWQIDEYSAYFPEVGENRDTILELARIEEEKFRRTMTKGKALVKRLEGEGKLDLDTLIELYDSHGMDPETVKQLTESPVEVPDNFYALVAQRHEDAQREREAVTKELPGGPTELMFYSDDCIDTFEATVTAVTKEGVVLDRTGFYPEGGGQESDRGSIDGVAVNYVEKVGTAVLHHLDGKWSHAVGDRVRCVVDVDRRKQLTRQHTATHIINSAARQVLGKHVMQTGAHKAEDIARLDITHYEGIPPDKLREIERIANDVVLEDREISATVMPRDKAEGTYGYSLYQGGAVPGRDIRVVNISDWDVEACGGTHLHRTGEVGLIKMLRAKRIQDGVVRLEFTAGREAVRVVQEMDAALDEVAGMLGSPKGEVVKALGALLSEYENNEKELRRLQKSAISSAAESIKDAGERVGDTLILHQTAPGGPKDLLRIGKKVLSSTSGPAVLLMGSSDRGALLFLSKGVPSVNLGKVMEEVAPLMDGKGGGKRDYAQAGGRNAEGVGPAIEKARALVKESLGGGK